MCEKMKNMFLIGFIMTDKKNDHVSDVGPVRLEGLPRHKRRRGEAETVDSDRTLQVVQRNLEGLTRQIPMAAVEDLLEAIQRRVVGVP